MFVIDHSLRRNIFVFSMRLLSTKFIALDKCLWNNLLADTVVTCHVWKSDFEYSCHFVLQAVCCEDHVHCCPSGYTCNVQTGTCLQGVTSIPWFSKLPAISLKKNVFSVKCPDGKAPCPDNTTCCELPHGAHGCCPVPEVWTPYSIWFICTQIRSSDVFCFQRLRAQEIVFHRNQFTFK